MIRLGELQRSSRIFVPKINVLIFKICPNDRMGEHFSHLPIDHQNFPQFNLL